MPWDSTTPDFLTLSRKAEQADSSEAFRLACMYESGTGTEKDYGMAMKLYLKAASEGSADAMLYLGLFMIIRSAALRRTRKRPPDGTVRPWKALRRQRGKAVLTPSTALESCAVTDLAPG